MACFDALQAIEAAWLRSKRSTCYSRHATLDRESFRPFALHDLAPLNFKDYSCACLKQYSWSTIKSISAVWQFFPSLCCSIARWGITDHPSTRSS